MKPQNSEQLKTKNFIFNISNIVKSSLFIKLCLVSIILFLIGVLFAYNEKPQYAVLAGTLICISILGLYFGVISWSLEICGFFDFFKKISKKELVLSFLVLISTFLFTFAEVGRDRFVYFWDYGGYWGVTIEQSRNFFINPFQTLHDLYSTINASEYNNIIPSLLALPMKIVGESFISYVTLIMFMFILPMSLVISFSIHKILVKANLKTISLPVTLLVTLSVPFLFTPLFFGYLDATCLLAASVLWLILIDYDWKKFDYKKALAMALMLLIVVLQRRYFAFYAVSYIVALSIPMLCKIVINKSSRKELIKYFLMNMAFVGFFCLIILIILFRGFLEQSIFNNFSLAYSAYSSGSNFDKFLDVGKSFGLFSYGIMLVGFLIGLLKKGTRFISLSLGLSFIITQILFFRIQNMGPHHKYLLYTQLILLTLIAVGVIYNYILQKYIRRVIVTVLTVLFITNFMYTFRFIPQSHLGSLLYSVESYQPKIRTDIPQLQLLANDLNNMASENNAKIYVLASSTLINDDILRKLYLPDVVNYMPNLNSSSNVDLRDGFPISFLSSDIVVVADPIQYHLRPEDQQVVGLLAKEILNGNVINNNFAFVKEYVIDQGVKLKVYKKQKQFNDQQIQYLRNAFDAIYPNSPDLFKNRINMESSN